MTCVWFWPTFTVEQLEQLIAWYFETHPEVEGISFTATASDDWDKWRFIVGSQT